MRLLVLLLLAFAEISGAQTGDAIRLKRPLEWEFKSVSRLPGGLLNKTKSNARFAVPKSNSWQSIGPSRLQSSTYSYVSGRVSSLAVDPDDSNTVYCAAAGGGLWKSTDAGSSWTPLSDNLARLSSGSIAIDPSNPTTLYYGTGELNFNLDGYPAQGFTSPPMPEIRGLSLSSREPFTIREESQSRRQMMQWSMLRVMLGYTGARTRVHRGLI